MTTNAVIEAFLALSPWEVFATILGIIYVILAAKESFWCWPAAFVSTLIYTALFWEGQLPMQAILNFYYMAMAIYGYQLWRKKSAEVDDFVVTTLSLPKHLIYIIGATALSIAIGYLTATTNSKLPFLDSAVMVFSVINTYLMAQKILENWIYWLVIDAAAIYLYWQTGFYVTIIMFGLYLVLAVYGYLEWSKSLKEQSLKEIPIEDENPYK
ncbi:MAG: nicotinamide riboside transporter PnuC [Cocleimonas sp.]